MLVIQKFTVDQILFRVLFVCLFGVTSGSAQGYFWLGTQESLLVVLEGHMGCPGIEPGLAMSMANALTAVLSLLPLYTKH